MLPSIKLDHQFRSMADEVGNVVFDRDLSSEAGSAQAVVAEFRPQNSFGIGRILSEYACVRAQPGGDFPGSLFRLVHRHLRCRGTPTPTLPRKRERGRPSPNGSTAAHPETSLFPLPLAGEGQGGGSLRNG